MGASGVRLVGKWIFGRGLVLGMGGGRFFLGGVIFGRRIGGGRLMLSRWI